MFARENLCRRGLLAATAIGLVVGCGTPAFAQETPADASDGSEANESTQAESTIVVTGSRIRRSVDATASTPVSVLDSENFDNRGFVQAGDALNELTSNAPSLGVTPGLTNGQATAGANYPNLFNLGPARTLTLVNGRRTVSTSLGLGDEAVDTNIIPIGLLDRIEVVQGGGAAVYGSGAIGGVVNYILKRKFEGLEADAQYTLSTRGDYSVKTIRLVAGQNFADGRGNIAFEADYSKSDPLVQRDRRNRRILGAGANPAPGAGANGIPTAISYDSYHQFIDASGLVVASPFAFDINGVVKSGTSGIAIGGDGNIILKNLGTPIFGAPFVTTGSDLDWPFIDNLPVTAGVERAVGTIIGHYDITDSLTFSTELLAARTKSRVVLGAAQINQFIPVLGFAYPNLGPIAFTRDNPYLSPATIAQLSAANPGFAAGQPLYLSKQATNLDPLNGDQFFTTTTWRALAALEGNFNVGTRNFNYELSYSHGEVKTDVDGYAAVFPNFRNAANAVRNASGQIVCAINLTAVTDPNCVPFNIFGVEKPSKGAMDYIVAKSGATTADTIGPVKNVQDDFLAILSGDAVKLPAGFAKFSLTYEHRRQRAAFTPLQGDQDGIFFSGIKALSGKGGYRTNEFSAELEIPLVGGDFTLPLVESLDLNGSYRYVDNSLAGSNSVWGVGGRWLLGEGLTLRASRSRNFRAPSINQVAAPPVVNIGSAAHPCSRTNINSGPAPSTRASNCLALFTANPTFGTTNLPPGTPNTPQNRLANFIGTTTAQVRTTTVGNPGLQNETSDTLTFGFVFQPDFVPGLTITVDRIDLKIGNALTLYRVTDFANTCFDAATPEDQFCGTFGYDANGDIATGLASTVNAGRLRFKADTFNLDYRFPLSGLSDSLPGTMNLKLSATHNRLQRIEFAGTTTRIDDTVALPRWSANLNATYRTGPFTLNYALLYLPSALLSETATAENSVDGIFRVKSNFRHDISVQYDVGDSFSIRAGIIDAFDRQNSYPALTYGSVLGRQIFVGASVKF